MIRELDRVILTADLPEHGLKTGTIKRRLHVARKRLRQQLERPSRARERKCNPELACV